MSHHPGESGEVGAPKRGGKFLVKPPVAERYKGSFDCLVARFANNNFAPDDKD